MKYFSLSFALMIGTAGLAQNIQVSPAQIDFGTVVYGQKDSVYLEVTNLSNSEIALEELRYFDVFETTPFRTHQIPETIPPLGTEGFYVVYEPLHNINHNSELVIKTSGGRGAVSVDLLGACTYPLSYYSGTFDLLDEALEDALKTITGQGYTQYGYNQARDEMFMYIDNQKVNGQGSTQNRLTRVYIGTDAVGYSSRTNLFNNYDVNTEHTFPQGFFNSNLPMRTDLHHLFPTDVNANSVRGNLRFGKVTGSPDWQQGGSKRGPDATGSTVFEPRDAHKGVVARSIFYFVTRYQNYGGHLSELMETTLREWSAEFPTTDVEIQRNQDISEFQNNRNPYVDYPQFLHRIHSIRLDQNRPNLGVLHTSHDMVDFGQVSADESVTVFALVLTNTGTRFISVTGIGLDADPVFSLQGDLPGVIHPGESAYIHIAVNAEQLEGIAEGTLNFSASNSPISLEVRAEGATGLRDMDRVRTFPAPNPAQDHFRLFGDLNQVKSLEIFDVQGRKSKAFTVSASGLYDLNGMVPGVYTLKIEFADGRHSTSKLVVKP